MDSDGDVDQCEDIKISHDAEIQEGSTRMALTKLRRSYEISMYHSF